MDWLPDWLFNAYLSHIKSYGFSMRVKRHEKLNLIRVDFSTYDLYLVEMSRWY